MAYNTKHPDNASKRSLQRHILNRMMKHPHKTQPYTIVCLPGRKCWEVEYLLPYKHDTYEGVGPGVEKIIALEQDQEVFEIIQDKYKDNDMVEVLNTSTTEFLYTYEDQVDLIYFDYYSYFSSKVKQDIEIMFERKVLSEGGKFIVNFLATRESVPNQIMQDRLVRKFCEIGKYELDVDSLDEDRKRCVAFNGLIGRYRSKSINDRTYSQGNNYVATTAPLWHRYKTLAGHSMLTGYFTLNSYPSKQSRGALYYAEEVWTTDPVRWGITDWNTEVSVKPQQNYDIWKTLVEDFYAKNHYTPSSLDLGRTSINCLTQIIRDLGLCPRHDRTVEDIKGEIDRIYQRVGVVCPFTVAQAKLGLKSGKNEKMNVRMIIDYCEEKGYPHRLLLNPIKTNINQLNTVKEYLDHLQADKPPSSFPKYRNLYFTILGRDCSFKNAHNTKLALEESLMRVGLTKDGEMTVQYTDQQLIDMYYKKDITINALASLRLMSRPLMIEYLKGLGVDVRHKNDRNKDKITPEKVLREFKKNESIIEVAVKFGVSTKYIKDILDELGVAPAKTGGYINLDEQALISDYKSGMTCPQIAKKYGVQIWVVHSRLKSAGIKVKERGGGVRINLPKEEIIADYQSGLSMAKIGRKQFVSGGTISKRLKEWGVAKSYNRP
jgi:hypothetical protein